jgi:ABC-type multidrug transport system fused ATPase/permease subunit
VATFWNELDQSRVIGTPAHRKAAKMNLWEFLVWIFWIYIAIACIWIFIVIIMDIFRDPSLNGWLKAVWVIFLVFLPFLAALIYLIARGHGMTQRELQRRGRAQSEADSYIRSVAATASPSAEIESAKKLLDSGAITQPEFDALKAKALNA